MCQPLILKRFGWNEQRYITVQTEFHV